MTGDADAPVSSVSNVALAEEVVFDEFDVRTVDHGDRLVAPEEGQLEAGILSDHPVRPNRNPHAQAQGSPHGLENHCQAVSIWLP